MAGVTQGSATAGRRAGSKVDRYGFVQLDLSQGSGSEDASVLSVETSSDSVVEVEAAASSVLDPVLGKPHVPASRPDAEGVAGAQHVRSDSSEDAPPPKWTTRGSQKANVVFRRALLKRPSAAGTAQAAKPDEKTAPEAKKPKLSQPPVKARPASAEPVIDSTPKASFSHERSRFQFMCRYGSGHGSTAKFAYDQNDSTGSSMGKARQLAREWCNERTP